MKELDLSKELKDFYEKNKQEKIVRNWEETLKKSKGWLQFDPFKFNVIGDGIEFESERPFKSVHTDNEFCFSLNQHSFLFYNTFFLFIGSSTYPTNGKIYFKVNYSNINDIEIKHSKINNLLHYNCKKHDFYSQNVIGDDYEKLFIQIDSISREIVEKEEEVKERLKEKEIEEQKKLTEENRLEVLKVQQTKFISFYDEDGNGIIDVIEGSDDFNLLLKKHQKSIVEIDRNYVKQFVQVSNYLKIKKGNIQSIFESLKTTPNLEVLREYYEILDENINTYHHVLVSSLNMIVSLVEDDLITFYEIYEVLDGLNMFDSKHERDISESFENISKDLTTIGDGLKELMYETRDMGNKISNGISRLTEITKESNQKVQEQLDGIGSTIKFGNILSTINLYETHGKNKIQNYISHKKDFPDLY